jgi:hypothetical protein
MKLELKIKHPTLGTTAFTIRNADCVLGRTKGHLIIQSEHCSSTHARLYQGPDGNLCIEDLKSRNGTLVNGTKVQKATLRIGDKIQIADVLITVQLYAASANPGTDATFHDQQTKDHTKPSFRRRPPKREVLVDVDPSLVVRQWPDSYDAMPSEKKDQFAEALDDEIPDEVVEKKRVGKK